MNSAPDLSIRPPTAAELPALAHVTSREERRRQEFPRPAGKKDKGEHDQTPAETRDAEPAGDKGDEPAGTIDLLA
jgi:hypothetical protein